MLYAPQECTISTQTMISKQFIHQMATFQQNSFLSHFSKVIIVGLGVQRVQKSVHRHSFRHWCHWFPWASGQCEQSAANYKRLLNWLTADLRNGDQWQRGMRLDRCFLGVRGEGGKKVKKGVGDGVGGRELYSTKVYLWNGKKKKKKKKKTIWLGKVFFFLVFNF